MRRQADHRESPLAPVAAAGLAVVTVAAPLAIGGTLLEIQLSLSALIAVLLLLAGLGRVGRQMRLPWPLWVPLILGLYGVVQLVPLPLTVLALISPNAAELYAAAGAELGAISVDRAATWTATAHQLAFFGAAWIAAAVSRERRLWLACAIALGVGVVTLIGFVQWLLDAEKIYGLYDALDRSRSFGFFATFVNPNSLAGFLVLGTLTGAAVALDLRNLNQRKIFLGCALLGLCGVAVAGSRGGHAALVIALVVFYWISGRNTEGASTLRRRALSSAQLLLPLGLIAVFAAFFYLPEWRALMSDEAPPDGRWNIWAAVPPYIADYWLTGSGRGTFATAFTQYHPSGLAGTVSHAENIVLHLAAEWGVLGAALAIAGGIAGWRHAFPKRKQAPRPIRWALLAGLAGVSLQQLTDFGFEAMGVSIPVAVAFGLAIGGGRLRRGRTPRRLERWLPLAVGGGLLGLTLLGSLGGATRTGDAVIAELQTSTAGASELEAKVISAFRAHPADPFLTLAAAERFAAMGSGELRRTLRWLNHTQRLFPHLGTASLLTARALDDAGFTAQAAGAHRRAMTKRPWDELRGVREAFGRFREPTHLARAVPPTERAMGRLGELLLSQSSPKLALAVMNEVRLFHPNLAAAQRIIGRACLATGDLKGALAAADWLDDNGQSSIAHGFRARAQWAGGDHPGARASLKEGFQRGGQRDAGFLKTASRVYGDLGDYDDARRTLDALWLVVGAVPLEAVAALRIRARLETRAGAPEAALLIWAQADRMVPSPTHAIEAARIEIELGRTDQARRRLEKAQREWPNHPGIDAVLATMPAGTGN